MRPSGRAVDEIRTLSIETHVIKNALGSCLIHCGDTQVLCTASLAERVPPFIKGSGLGWVTAEYGMLPGATSTRNRREAVAGKQTGRTQEIQRLIGRTLRAGVDRVLMGEHQITIDCDVLQADGGTRCAAITGGWVALKLAMQELLKRGTLKEDPLKTNIAAISCGIYNTKPVVDLDYAEDSEAGLDANFVMTGALDLVEVQASAEGATFTRAEMNSLTNLAEKGISELVKAQNDAVS